MKGKPLLVWCLGLLTALLIVATFVGALWPASERSNDEGSRAPVVGRRPDAPPSGKAGIRVELREDPAAGKAREQPLGAQMQAGSPAQDPGTEVTAPEWPPEQGWPDGRVEALRLIDRGEGQLLVIGHVPDKAIDPATGLRLLSLGNISTPGLERYVEDFNREMIRAALAGDFRVPSSPGSGEAFRRPKVERLSRHPWLTLQALADPPDARLLCDLTGRWISLGSREGVRRGMIFAVWKPDGPFRTVRALVSVVRAGEVSSAVRIVRRVPASVAGFLDDAAPNDLEGLIVSSPFFAAEAGPVRVHTHPRCRQDWTARLRAQGCMVLDDEEEFADVVILDDDSWEVRGAHTPTGAIAVPEAAVSYFLEP